MAESIERLEGTLGLMKSGMTNISTGCIEKLSADQLEERIATARKLLHQLPSDVELLRQRDSDSIVAKRARVRSKTAEIQSIHAEIQRLIAGPIDKRKALTAQLADTQEELDRIVSEMQRARTEAGVPGRVHPLGSVPSIAMSPISSSAPGHLTALQIAGVSEAIRAGRMIQAVKIYREATGVGLSEGKQAIDAVWGELA